jgi:hypothetical protein
MAACTLAICLGSCGPRPNQHYYHDVYYTLYKLENGLDKVDWDPRRVDQPTKDLVSSFLDHNKQYFNRSPTYRACSRILPGLFTGQSSMMISGMEDYQLAARSIIPAIFGTLQDEVMKSGVPIDTEAIKQEALSGGGGTPPY